MFFILEYKLYFMATSQWGKIYYQDVYTGILQQEPGGRCVFTYDTSYLESGLPAIALSFPKQREPFICERGLHPFFDNLIAEGWFQNAQAKALGVDTRDRFALLLGFGFDLAGAVSVLDPEPRKHMAPLHADDVTTAALLGRASLSGIQRKLLVVKEGNKYRPAVGNELSSHIAKLSSGNLTDIIELEFLTTQAAKQLLPEDSIVNMEIGSIASITEEALIIERFDRSPAGKRIHFEEFNQLLGHYSGNDKYESSYEAMGQFICTNPNCIKAEADKLFRRILACLLLGNTDAHLKNFAMFHTRDGLRLTPAYDLVATARYKEYHTIALSIGGARDLDIGALKAKHILELGYGFGLNANAIQLAIADLSNRLPLAQSIVAESNIGTPMLRKKLVDIMEKRWKGSFVSIGQLLSKRQNKGGKHKNLLNND